jgi:hypothetical protein
MASGGRSPVVCDHNGLGKATLERVEAPRGCVTALMCPGFRGLHYVLRRLHGEDDAVETVRNLREVIDARLPDERLLLGVPLRIVSPAATAGPHHSASM